MSRFARERRVFFFEEPVFEDTNAPYLRAGVCSQSGVEVLTPVLPCGMSAQETTAASRQLLASALTERKVQDYVLWYYTPMARGFAANLRAELTIYDCMDELCAFAGAPAAMRINEQQLFTEADLVFTGGASLFECKRTQHPSVHLFPSSVDVEHFARARGPLEEPADQSSIPRPRLGYSGVIDERMDLNLLREVSNRRPDWQLVLLGPVVKIDPASLPKAANIHYLGMKAYAELPFYLHGWDLAMLPFARNESTRFISPTKTPEYLAAGLQVISTPIHDVVTPYGDLGLVSIANGVAEFVDSSELLLARPLSLDFRRSVDNFLSRSSWDKTWNDMNRLIENSYTLKSFPAVSRPQAASAIQTRLKGDAHV